VRGIIAGLNNREIAEKLGLAEQSIKNILSITYQKCQVRNRLELMLFAIKHDILSH
jgi:DNA-binding NarL/FixJ family response regulator